MRKYHIKTWKISREHIFNPMRYTGIIFNYLFSTYIIMGPNKGTLKNPSNTPGTIEPRGLRVAFNWALIINWALTPLGQQWIKIPVPTLTSLFGNSQKMNFVSCLNLRNIIVFTIVRCEYETNWNIIWFLSKRKIINVQ